MGAQVATPLATRQFSLQGRSLWQWKKSSKTFSNAIKKFTRKSKKIDDKINRSRHGFPHWDNVTIRQICSKRFRVSYTPSLYLPTLPSPPPIPSFALSNPRLSFFFLFKFKCFETISFSGSRNSEIACSSNRNKKSQESWTKKKKKIFLFALSVTYSHSVAIYGPEKPTFF